jgi:hypothetical protein
MTGWLAYRWTRPVYYAYGSGGNVVYRDQVVYVDGERAATSNEYYEQALALAQSVPTVDPDKVEWLPLGVYAAARQGTAQAGSYLQLAVSKEGIIGGTFFNETTKTSRPVEGMVDKKTQRTAWMFTDGKNTDVVMETSIQNLTKDTASVLVHFGPERAEQADLIRMEAPKEE